jgi:hypothetical protein
MMGRRRASPFVEAGFTGVMDPAFCAGQRGSVAYKRLAFLRRGAAGDLGYGRKSFNDLMLDVTRDRESLTSFYADGVAPYNGDEIAGSAMLRVNGG